jgi:hypothetical protein
MPSTGSHSPAPRLSAFLATVAADVGAAHLKGAVVLVALQRPVDDLIRTALSLNPYHHGTESPWSHTFLIAETYSGVNTQILDCTIRSPDGTVAWTEPLDQTLNEILHKSGGIYSGHVRDYDDARVTHVGVKLLKTLSTAQCDAIIAAATALQAGHYYYDVPGLLRELIRLLTGIAIPADPQRLFCSAFCQEAYRTALGSFGDFNPALATADITPDDIWYSRTRTPYPPTAP